MHIVSYKVRDRIVSEKVEVCLCSDQGSSAAGDGTEEVTEVVIIETDCIVIGRRADEGVGT